MANQITVNSGSGNITVTTSRAVIGTVANVASANYANFAGEVVDPSQPNITSVGNLTSLNVVGTTTTGNLVVSGNLQVGNLVANSANYANFAGVAYSVAGANVSGTVANATFATTAGSANTANSATVANSANAVAGANVTGTVANATFATTAGSANTANSATVANSANAVAGANVSGTVANATYADNAGNANTANSATVANSANSVTLANVSGAGNIASINLDGSSSNVLYGNGIFAPAAGGNTANANYANFAGDVVNSTQSNITTLGTLTNVITSGQITSTRAGNASDGGGQLYLNGSGNNRIDFNTNGTGAPTTTTRSNGTKVTLFPAISNTQTDYAMGIDAATMWSSLPLNDPSFKFKWYGNTTEVANLDGAGNFAVAGNISAVNINGNVANANYANFAGNAFSVDGANISGAVANATFALDAGNANIANIAYSVDAANVSGLGNIATINLDGNASNVLFGNGSFGPEGSSGNANYANFAGNAFSVDGGNVVGAVANATFALDAGNANIANIAYSVDAANVSGLGNIATINLDGNASNLLDGTGNFVAIPTSTANANYANFAGTVLTNAQPNITSVGNLSALTVTGNITSNTINWSNSLSYNGSGTGDKILVQSDLPGGTAVRNLPMRAGNITNASASNTTAGGMLVQGGSAVSTDAGNAFIARGGVMVMFGGLATSANGAASSGAVQLSVGTANSNNANATAGVLFLTSGSANAINGNAIMSGVTIGAGTAVATNGNASGGTFALVGANSRTITSGNAVGQTFQILSGNAISQNGNATSGSIAITTANAVANVTAGTATVGSISINTGTANGITANVLGNINIGTAGGLNSINIGQSSSPVIIAGNLSANNANITNNVAANNANITSNLSANIVNATYLYGDGSNISNISAGTPNSIQNGNSIVDFTGVDGDLNISTNNITNGIQVSGRSLILNGVNTVGNISSIQLTNGSLNWNLIDTQFGGGTPFGMNRYITGFMDPMNYFTARGTPSSQSDVLAGDIAFNERVQVLYDGNTKTIFNSDVTVLSFSPSNTVAATYAISSNDDQANSVFQVNFGTSNVAGDLNATGNINVNSGNVIIGADGSLDYLRTFGSFTSNVTQTNSNVGNAIYMTLNNDEGSNGVSIVSSTQITTARTGLYNLQFSAQIEKTDTGTDTVEVWLTKNGSAVANSATRLALQGNSEKDVAAWNWLVDSANVNDYYEIAWGSTDANMQLVAIDSANTLSGVAIPSLIVTVVPVGA